MSKKLESNNVIILNAVIILLFIGILVAVNLFLLNRMNTTISTINETYHRKVDVINRMSRIVRDRTLAMFNMYLSDDFVNIDNKYMEFQQMAADFVVLREQLDQMYLYKEEKAVLEEALDIIKITQPLQNSIVDRIHAGNTTNVYRDISQKDMPLENELWNAFNAFTRLAQEHAQTARQQAKESFKQSIITVITVAAITAIIIVLLMMNSLRRIQKIESRLIDRAESLDWDATHDPLTNTWNRRFLEHKVNLLITTENDSDSQHTLVYIDLDNFKPINDTYGHHTGDEFLKGILDMLEACIRKNDTLARVGGDEFAVLLENCNVKKAQQIAECIQGRISQHTISHEHGPIKIDGCSIGIAVLDSEVKDFQHLLKHADAACYAAKRAGKNRIFVANR